MNINKLTAAIMVAAPLTIASPLIQAADSFLIAPEMGTINFDARLRYEEVNNSSAKDDADALTLRARLGYLTPDFNGFKGFVELESTTPLGGRDYHEGVTLNAGADRSNYSVIADPDNSSELNRAWVSYNGFDDTLIKFGRQRIVLDNSRFVGNVGWRQNEQTFDALTVVNTSLQDTQIVVAYVDNVQTIFGTHVEADVPVFNLKYSGLPLGDLTAYGYFIDIDASSATDRDTLGLRFNGSTQLSDNWAVLYTAEYAQQEIDRAVLSDENVGYYLVEGGVKFAGVTAKITREVQEGNNGASFKTPLGTNHKFNGWADQFLATPDDGLEDTFLTLSTTVVGIKLVAVYHEFEAEDSGVDYGDELNLSAAKAFGKNYKVLVKYASYDRGDSISGKADKDKFWIQGEVSF
jgi:hypothetical protein